MRYWIRSVDLKTANYCDNYDCPLARAVKRKHPLCHVQVNSRYVFINGKSYHIATGSEFDINANTKEEAIQFARWRHGEAIWTARPY